MIPENAHYLLADNVVVLAHCLVCCHRDPDPDWSCCSAHLCDNWSFFYFILPLWCSIDCSGVCVFDWWWRDHAGGRSPCCPSGKGQGRGWSSIAFLLRTGQIQVPRGQSKPSDPWWPAWTQGLPEVSHHNQAGTSLNIWLLLITNKLHSKCYLSCFQSVCLLL